MPVYVASNFTLIELAFHGVLYAILFYMAAFVARRNFILRRKSDEERQAEAEVAKTWTSSISAFFSDFVEFTKDPIPFVLETAAANSDTVEYRAGLEARLYLHVLWSLMKLFTLLAIVALAIVLPINFLTSRFVSVLLFPC